MENAQTEQKQTWEAPELKVLDAAEHTLAGNTTPSVDGGTFSS